MNNPVESGFQKQSFLLCILKSLVYVKDKSNLILNIYNNIKYFIEILKKKLNYSFYPWNI